MRLTVLLIAMLASTIGHRVKAQNDSLLTAWKNPALNDTLRAEALSAYCYQISRTNLDSVRNYTHKLTDFASRKGLKLYTAKALYLQGLSHRIFLNTDSALYFFDKAKTYFEVLGEEALLAKTQNNVGSIYFRLNKFDKALQHYKAALTIYERIGETRGTADIYNNLAILLMEIEDWKQATAYLEKAKTTYQELGAETQVIVSLINLGIVAGETNNTDVAILHLNNALDYWHKNGTAFALVDIHQLQAANYLQKDWPDSAKTYIDKSLSLIADKEPTDTIQLIVSYELMGKYYEQINADSSIYWLEQVMQLTTPEERKSFLTEEAAVLLYELYKAKNWNTKALQQLELVREIERETNDIELQKAIIKAVAEQDFKNQLALITLEQEAEKSKLKNQQERDFLLTIAGASILTVLLMVTSIIVYLVNKKHKAALIAEVGNLKLKLQDQTNQSTSSTPGLNRPVIDAFTNGKLNQTDWNVIETLFNNLNFTNKEIANAISLSPDGVNSSLKKMYRLFDVSSDRKSKRISLILKITQISMGTDDSDQ